MSSRAEKQRLQLQFLELVYGKTQGSERRLVNVWDLGRELDCDLQTTATIAQYLVGEGLIKFSTTGDTLSITSQGVAQIENASARINWLHISDLHIGQENYDRRIVLTALLDDARHRAGNIDASLDKIDMVFLTGDLVLSGREEEYEIAYREFIEPLVDELEIETADLSQQVFVVPGNHDVDRSRIGFAARAIRGALRDPGDIRDLLHDGSELEPLIRAQKAYFDFFSDTFGGIELVSPANHYVQRVRIPGRGDIAVIGLNSAWLSQDDQDRGKLILGEPQVEAALERSTDADLVICLLHHPFEWLNGENPDTARCKTLLLKECDVILSGHVHTPDLVSARSLDGETVFIPAGGGFTDRDAWLSYNYVSLNLDSGRGTVFFRRYSDVRREWVKDVELTGDSPDGKSGFAIRPLRLTGEPSVVEIARPELRSLLEEEEGFLDWAERSQNTLTELTVSMQEVGLKTSTASHKMSITTERLQWAKGDYRKANALVSQLASVITEHANDISGISEQMRDKWRMFYDSFRPFLLLDSEDLKRFVEASGDTDTYVKQALDLAVTLDTVTGQIDVLRNSVGGLRSQMRKLRGVSRVLNSAVRKSDQAHGHFLDTLDEMRKDMDHLSELSKNLPSIVESLGFPPGADLGEDSL